MHAGVLTDYYFVPMRTRGVCWEGDETKSNAFRERGRLGYHSYSLLLLLHVTAFPPGFFCAASFFRRLKWHVVLVVALEGEKEKEKERSAAHSYLVRR